MSGPKPLRALIAAYRPAGERIAAGGEAAILAAAWPDAVGADVARRTRTAGFRDGALTVLTPSSAWSHQLTFLTPTILERLRESCSGIALRRLRFIVATGRSRLLLRGAAPARAPRAKDTRSAGPAELGATDEAAIDGIPVPGDDLDALLVRLRRAQTRLDESRVRAGWQRCAGCGCWTQDRARQPRCAVCRQQERKMSDGAIARMLADAPWLAHAQVHEHLPHADLRSYERVRRTLATQWELQMFNARARLRRDAIQAGDRVIAWSYAMLVAQRPRAELSDAVLANIVGAQWAAAL
ncbi:MAG: DUF721 domain-containing protein, partial [Candidatus Eremiobacteraeota bacterium]|nr:DUF721 domain-containing protein [Candidatus Eremiobacteraeota bacterium]